MSWDDIHELTALFTIHGMAGMNRSDEVHAESQETQNIDGSKESEETEDAPHRDRSRDDSKHEVSNRMHPNRVDISREDVAALSTSTSTVCNDDRARKRNDDRKRSEQCSSRGINIGGITDISAVPVPCSPSPIESVSTLCSTKHVMPDIPITSNIDAADHGPLRPISESNPALSLPPMDTPPSPPPSPPTTLMLESTEEKVNSLLAMLNAPMNGSNDNEHHEKVDGEDQVHRTNGTVNGLHPMSTNFGNITVNNTFNTFNGVHAAQCQQYSIPMLPANYTPFKISNVNTRGHPTKVDMDGVVGSVCSDREEQRNTNGADERISTQILSVLPKLIHDDF